MLDRTRDWQEYVAATPNQAVTSIVVLGALLNPPDSQVVVLVREALVTCRGSGAASAFLAELRRATTIAGGALTRGGVPLLSTQSPDGPNGRASVARLFCATATNGGAATPVTYVDTDSLLDQQDVGGAYSESRCHFRYRGLVLAPGEALLVRASSGAAVSPSFRVNWLELPHENLDLRRAIEDLRMRGML